MNSKSTSMIRKSNGISPNITQSKTDDFMFFVLRSKASTFEDVTSYEDIFCVVQDSYADRINKGNTFVTPRAQRKPSTAERISSTNACNLPLEPISFSNTSSTNVCNLPFELTSLWNTSEQTKNNNHGSNMKATFNLKLFRDYLTFFEVHPESSIFYMDNKHKLCLIQTETEFLELWKFAKSCAKHNKAVLLLVDPGNSPNDNMIKSSDMISTVNDLKNLNVDNGNIPDNFQSKQSTIEVNNSNVQSSDQLFEQHNDCNTFSPFLNLTTSRSRMFTKENHDTKLESIVPSNMNNQDSINGAPPKWFVQYMEQFKQDIIKEVSDQVMVNVKKNINECPMKSSGHAQPEDTVQSDTQVYNHRSKSNRPKNNLLIDQKRQYKSIVKTRKKKEKKLEEKLEYNSKDDNVKEKANNNNKIYYTSKFMNDANNIFMSNNTTTKNETVNNHDSMPPDFLESEQPLKENLYEPNVANVIEGSEFRMNCSITEHQMLDKTNFTSKTCHCGCDTENISLSSDVSNGEDPSTECNFEMIQKPSNEEVKRFFMKNEGKNSKNHLGFCLLPEMSPSQPSTICIDEDHFTANANNIPTSSENSDLNIPIFHKFSDDKSSVHDDINTDMHNACPCSISNKCQDSNINEFTKSVCKKIIENSSVPPDEINTESDFRNSYVTTKPTNTIYPEFQEMRQDYQSPTNLNDLTLSFHSHTTSIADPFLSCKGSDHDYTKHSLSNSSKPKSSKEENTCEQIKQEITNKDPDRKMSKEKNNGKSGKHVNEDNAAKPAEPVHILPETLVTGALHLASIAYGTAREAIVKIRTNSKDGRPSHKWVTRQ